MFKIVHLITGLGTGGAEMMLYKLLSRIAHNHFAPTVISLSDRGTLGVRIEALGISVYAIGMKSGKPSLASIWKLLKAVRNLKPDIIQGWMYHGNLAAQISSAFSPGSPPVLWNIRQSLYSLEYEKRATAAVIRAGSFLSNFPRHIVYNSKTSAEQHEALGYRENKRILKPNGFDTDIFKPSRETRKAVRMELNIPDASLLIGLIGRYHPVKDHANFIRAAARLGKSHPSAHFIMAGTQVDENNKTLQQHVDDLNLLPQIHLLGERSDIPRITAALDIATSSSFAEGFPNVIGEAMACGVPCVVTDVGDAAWLVGDTGRVVPPRDSEALAGAWAELIEMGDEQRMILGQRARQRILEKFSLDDMVKCYEQLYFEVLGGEKLQ
jgi:glycosyltransferase involved in cell wall biosynthesis